jgi:predicted O-linked N-acetylglucosamine transferase (SPINDLY family)
VTGLDAVPTIPETFDLAWQSQQAGDFSKAEGLYRQVVEADPNHLYAWGGLATSCQAQGKLAEAATGLERIVQLVPDNVSAHNCLGIVLVQQGKLEQALASLKAALRCQPNNAEVHNNLGTVFARLGRTTEAIDSYRQAQRLRADYAQAHFNLGLVLRENGDSDQAKAEFQEAVRCQSNYAEALHELGNIFSDRQDFAEAEQRYWQALQLRPDRAETHLNLGIALQSQGRLEEAADCCRQALTLHPNLAEAYVSLGTAMHGLGRLADAVMAYGQALQLNPSYAEAYYNLGKALHGQARFDEAAAYYRQALALKPNMAAAHINLGSALQSQGLLVEAVTSYRQSLAIDPTIASAHNNLGLALCEFGQFEDAANAYKHALELQPENAEVLVNYATVLKEQGKAAEALETVIACRRALQSNIESPRVVAQIVNQLQQLCLWEDIEKFSQQVIDAVAAGVPDGNAGPVDPFLYMSLPVATSAEQQQRCASQWAEQRLRCSDVPSQVIALKDRRLDRGDSKITLGYISNDYHNHPVARMIPELIEKHNRERFVVNAYSYCQDDGSTIRRRLVKAFDRFVEIKDAGFLAAARQIEADGVDILIDLSGYTGQARTRILALRPAPIQVNYLGYPGTLAAPFADYILVDDFVVPAEQQPFFSEKLVHLPGCYQVNDSTRQIAESIPSRADCGLPEEGFVFCCFNGSHKITREFFDLWMRLLTAIPGSVLWLLEDSTVTSANLRKEAEVRGVVGERLVFGPRLPVADHLARHRQADLFLDTLPYNAHTTASDALWAGCPVLTIAGQTFPSRVAGSLLRTMGLPELITTTLPEYESLALRLAQDEHYLKELKARLQTNLMTSRLFNGEQFARAIEQAYEKMWEIYRAGEAPCAFAVSPS